MQAITLTFAGKQSSLRDALAFDVRYESCQGFAETA